MYCKLNDAGADIATQQKHREQAPSAEAGGQMAGTGVYND